MEFKLKDYHRNVPDDKLLNDVKRVADLLGVEILSKGKYQEYGRFSSSTIEKRFGLWTAL